jgi:hypothetical protein
MWASATSPPGDEHDGCGDMIRAARKRGLRQARWARVAYHRIQQAKADRRSPTDMDWFARRSVALTQTLLSAGGEEANEAELED